MFVANFIKWALDQYNFTQVYRSYGRFVHISDCFRNINIKGKFGFVEIDNEDDAEDAIKDLDGKSFNGGRLV